MKGPAALAALQDRYRLVEPYGEPVNQPPSPWAFQFTVTDKNGVVQQLHWDLVQDEYFTWYNGVFLCWYSEGIWKRIAGCDLYPTTYPDRYSMLVEDCVTDFNEQIALRFTGGGGGGGHPVDQACYDYLTAHLIWDATAQVFRAQ
jgi:hypothetical protein